MFRFFTALFLILTLLMFYKPGNAAAAAGDCSSTDEGVEVNFKLPGESRVFSELTVGQGQEFSVVIKVKTNRLRTDANYSAAVWSGRGGISFSYGSSEEVPASNAARDGDYSIIELPFKSGISRAVGQDYSTNDTHILINYDRPRETMTDYCYSEKGKLALRPQELADVGSCPIEFPDNIQYGEDTHGIVAELKPIRDVKYALMVYPGDVTSQISTSYDRTQDFPVLRSVPGRNNLPNTQKFLTQVDPGTNIDLNFSRIPGAGPLDIGKYTAVLFAYYNAVAVWKPGFACGVKVFEVTNDSTTPIASPSPGSGVKSPDGKCYLLPDPLVSNSDLKIVATNMQTADYSASDRYRADLIQDGTLKRIDPQTVSKSAIQSAGNSFTFSLGRPGAGKYSVYLYKDDSTNDRICYVENFSIEQRAEASVPGSTTITNPNKCENVTCPSDEACYAGACYKKSSSTGEKCDNGRPGIKTAIGCIPTEPGILIAGLLRYISGFAGGIALLMMVFGSLRMLTSAGNADSLKNGREQFVSAVIGLLFVLFSVLLLQIVGVDILGLPGWIK